MSAETPEQSEVSASDWATTRGKKWVENLGPTERMLAPVDVPLLSALSLDGAVRVADIGCGGGHTTRAIARALPDGVGGGNKVIVHGVDVSPDVIDAAQKASAEAGIDAAFYCLDAGVALPPWEQGYDRLSSRFGVMFFDDPAQAFSNLSSWLAPGGRFAFAVWAELGRNPWMSCLREVVAGLVELPAPQPDAPGPFRYASAPRFCALLEGSGFVDVSAEPWESEVQLGGGLSASEAAAFCLTAFSVGDLVGGDAGLLAQASEGLYEAFKSYETDGLVLIPAAVHLVTGSAPG